MRLSGARPISHLTEPIGVSARRLIPLLAIGALAVPGIAGAQQRVVEPVSPVESQGNQIFPWSASGQSAYGSADGNRMIYIDGALIVDLKVATRTATGWTTRRLDAQLADTVMRLQDYSPDMSAVVWSEVPQIDPTPGGPAGIFVAYDGKALPVTTFDAGVPFPNRPYYLAGSEDRKRLILRAPAGALPGPTSNTSLYRWSLADGLEPIDVDMARYAGADCVDKPTKYRREDLATMAAANLNAQMGVSDDGSAVVVATPACTNAGTPVPSHLVLWHEDGTSTDIAVPVAGGDDGDAAFLGMSGDGSRVFFTTAAKLEPSDANGAADLYVWDDGELTRLTDGALVTGQAEVSPDGSTVWFESGQPIDGLGEAGQPNIFTWDGELQLVRTFAIAPSLHNDGIPTSQLSEDGRYLVYGQFGDPVTGASSGWEIRRIGRDGDAECISCVPDGVAEVPSVLYQPMLPLPFFSVGISNGTNPSGSWDRQRAWEPYISRDGNTIVFESNQPLDPRDINGIKDTYAWENGKQVLISSGTEPAMGTASGMSADGSSIFFVQTGTQNVPGVTDTYRKAWVARVGGGFPNAHDGDDACGTGCQGPLTTPPALPVAATVTFAGPGNVPPPPVVDERPKPTVRPSVTKPKTVRGTSAAIRVKVAGAGVIRLSGARIGTVKRTASKAGTYSIRVRLTKAWQRSLARHGILTAGVKVQFTPTGGASASRSVQLRFTKAKSKKSTSKKAAR